jgi:alanine racemase
VSGLTVAVDYGAITRNARILLERAGGAGLMAVVKADGYGHGLVETARAARAGGASWLGVAQPEEALALREAGDSGRLFAWLYGPDLPAAALIAADVDLSVSSLSNLKAVLAGAKEAGSRARIHVCVDTGLGREGATPDDLPALLDAVERERSAGTVEAVGIWSHLAWADAPGHPTIDDQAEVFRFALDLASERGLTFEVRHLANSAAALTRPDLRFDLVRPGIALYGLSPIAGADAADPALTPAMSVTSVVALVKKVRAGHGVSYGHDYVTERETYLGLVPVGYADGVFRSAGGRAEVAIRGHRYRIAGRVCMDQFVVDLGPSTSVAEGDVVTLIGPDGPTAREWADAAGTIDYEIVCRFGGLRPKVVAG